MASNDLFAQMYGNQSPQHAYFKKLLDQGLDTSPIQSPWQGASRMAMALLAGLDLRDQDQQEKASQALRMNLPGLGPSDAAASAPAAAPMVNALAQGGDTSPIVGAGVGAGQSYQKAISGIESGGKYDAQGPVIASGPMAGQRALGKYQVMESNVDPWARKFLGRSVSTDEFMKNPSIQDALFNGQFGEYAQKYGPNGAARAWFAGPGGMNDPTRKDQLGTSVAQYGQKFDAGMGNQPMQRDDAMLPPNATPTQGGPVPGMPQPTVTPQPNAGAQMPQRSAVQIDPQMAQQIRTMLGSKDPAIQQQGMELYKQYAKPREETRPLTNPQDRARYGIAPTDSNPYQVDSKGEVKPINPQPFNVNVNNQGESKFAQAYGEGKAADALGLERSADKIMQERQQLQVFKSLVQDFKTGKLAPAQMTVGAWADAIGMNPETLTKIGIPANAAVNGQLIESLSNQMTLGMIGTKGGEGGTMPANNFSDADRKFLQNTVPGLARVQGGNLVLAEIKQRGLDRSMDKIAMWDDYRSQGKSYETFERDWRQKVRNSPSIFADIPDMVRQLTAPPPDPGTPPPAAGGTGGVRRFNPATGKIE